MVIGYNAITFDLFAVNAAGGAGDAAEADAGAEGGQSAAGWRDTGGVVIKYPGLGGWSLLRAVPAASAAIRKAAAQGYQALAWRAVATAAVAGVQEPRRSGPASSSRGRSAAEPRLTT